jgi:L-asparaginase
VISALSKLEVVYLGGTFACIGKPLAPMDSNALSDVLTQALNQESINSDLVSASVQLNITCPIKICDSSQLSSQAFMQLEQALCHLPEAPCLIITGTDTLSFLSSYIALSRCHPHCCIIASMDTLINPINAKLNPDSFAFKSLLSALQRLSGEAGVSCVVDGEDLHPLSLSKLHSRSPKAFADSWGAIYADLKEADRSRAQFYDQQFCPQNTDLSHSPVIAVCFATPSHEPLVNQLEQLAHEPPDALLLVGYGAGNFVQTQQIEQLLRCISTQSLIMITTQVNFGGCSLDYEAGTWLSQFAVSSGQLSYPASYAALLYTCTRYTALNDRKKNLALIAN